MDHILLIGFGGPEKPEDIGPFLRVVAAGRGIPDARLKEVAHHYERIGGRSPYNESVYRLQKNLAGSLRSAGRDLPVFLGMRNWNPFLKETLAGIKAKGLKSGLGVILAPHRSAASCRRYKENVNEARAAAAAPEIEYRYLEPWHENPLFIRAQADEVRSTLRRLSPEFRNAVHLLFTAHSIPLPMLAECGYCDYAAAFRNSSELVAKEFSGIPWSLAYQSRSGDPRRPWLEPDVREVLKKIAERGGRAAAVVPVGFLFDNAEILYDLDVEAKKEAETLGLHYVRAATVGDHPKIVQMFSELIENHFHDVTGRNDDDFGIGNGIASKSDGSGQAPQGLLD